MIKGGENFAHICAGATSNKIGSFSFTTGKRIKVIHFQVVNKAALSYLLKMGGTRNKHMIKLSKGIWHSLLNHNIGVSQQNASLQY